MSNKLKFVAVIILCLIATLLIVNRANSQDIKKFNTKIDNYELKLLPKIPHLGDAPMSVIKQDFTLTLRDNVTMDCAKFYPSVSNPYLPNGYYTVVMVHGYGDRKETLEGFANAQASYGYVVYTYSVRGQGNSGGLSNLMSTTEAQDLIELVNFIRTDFSTGLDTSNILIMGGSQGGTLPYMAACMGGLKVKTIISALSSPTFASSWIENGCIKMTYLWTIDYVPDTARYAPLVVAMRNWCYSSAKDKWDSLAYWMPINRNFENIVSQCQIPIMIENCWQDKFFNAYGNISTIPALTAPKRYYFGAVMGHGGDTSWSEDQWHMNFFNEWFFQWLWGMDEGILTRPKFHYASTTFPVNSINMWSFQHDSSSVWPPVGITNTKLYFTASSKLGTTYDNNNNDNVSLKNQVSNGYTMQQAVESEFTGTAFTNKFKKASVTFTSNALTRNTQITGTPTINLDYSSSANVCQFNFQIYEVSGTTVKLVNRINYTDRAYTTNQRKTKLINGISLSHIFKAGSKIRIVVTNLDTAPDDVRFLGTNPFVLPVMANATHKIYLSNNCYINLPIVGSAPFSSHMIPGTETAENTFKLEQNYPNPFNPVTNINFTIPHNDFVTLKVYDIAGKEVKTLVSENKQSGSYNIKFSGADLSSGVYFYKLTAGTYTEVRKMFLIK